MRNQFIGRWGTQIIISSATITTGMLWGNSSIIATEITQAEEKEPDIELTVIDKLLNEPVFSPFRREGTVKDSTRPVYVNANSV